MPLRAFNRDNLGSTTSAPYYDVGDSPLAVVATSLYGVDHVIPQNHQVLLPWIALPPSGLDGPEMYQLARTLLYSVPGQVQHLDPENLDEVNRDAQLALQRQEFQLEHTFTDYMPPGYALMTASPEFVGVLAYDNQGFGMGVFNPQGVVRYAPTGMRGQIVGWSVPAQRVIASMGAINPRGLVNTSLASQHPPGPPEPNEPDPPSLWDRLEADAP